MSQADRRHRFSRKSDVDPNKVLIKTKSSNGVSFKCSEAINIFTKLISSLLALIIKFLKLRNCVQ